jgi:HlyD family secretion protein
MQIWASVNEADIGRIYDGQRVQFTVDAFPGEEFDGVVSQVRLNATMTQNVVTYTVVVAIDNRDGRLKPYLTADVHFETGRKDDVLMVPNAALRWFPQPDQVSPSAIDDYLQLQQLRAGTGRASNRKRTVPLSVVWVEDGEGRVRPIRVTVGITDGLHTEVSSPELEEGLSVVTGGGQRLHDRFLP